MNVYYGAEGDCANDDYVYDATYQKCCFGCGGVSVDDDVRPMHKMKTWVISVGKIGSLENQDNFGSRSGGSNMLLTKSSTTYNVNYKLMKEVLVTTTTNLK